MWKINLKRLSTKMGYYKYHAGCPEQCSRSQEENKK